MYKTFWRTALAATLLMGSAWAQVNVLGKDVQIHGFFQQGFALSSGNNFLTMRTRDGSWAMTDGGLNVATRLTSRLRVGAQAYSRNIGDLGNGQVQIDWAYADYKFSDMFGVRAGKVKTALGLFNDTQDMEFLYPFALLPQSVYPSDLRANTIAHLGGDIYGSIGLKKAGRVNYVLWAGRLPEDRRGGYYYGSRDAGSPLTNFAQSAKGADVKWATPLSGLTLGYSYFYTLRYANARLLTFRGRPIPGGLPYRSDQDNTIHALSADYQRGGLRLSAEFWRNDGFGRFSGAPIPASVQIPQSWYVMGSYRFNKRLEVGSYYSDFINNRTRDFTPDVGIRGPVVSTRFDLTSRWHLKLEGHFLEGIGGNFSFRGFYPSTNPQGLQARTNLFVMRTGWVF